jgi:carbon-monoxide dehydrogenase medium subunit
VGALTRHATLEQDPVAREHLPLLSEVIPWIAYTAVRHRGTIGGSFAFGAPYAELPLLAVTLGGEVVVAGASGRRTVPAEEFFVGHYETALQQGELVVEVRFVIPEAGTGHGFQEIARRRHDYAIASAATAIRVDGSGQVAHVRLGVGGAHPFPIRVRAAEEALVGRDPTSDAVEAAAAAAAAAIEPWVENELDITYRRRVVAVLARRSLEQAIERAQEARA